MTPTPATQARPPVTAAACRQIAADSDSGLGVTQPRPAGDHRDVHR